MARQKLKVPQAVGAVPAPWGFEYVETFGKHADAWDDLLERYAKDGWRLAFMIHDEDQIHKPQVRLVFERPRQGPEDELGYPIEEDV